MNALRSTPCAHCPHDFDGHRLLVLDLTRVLGIVLCTTPGCPCGATWGAGTAPSSPDRIAATRDAVRRIITDGTLLPRFLQ